MFGSRVREKHFLKSGAVTIKKNRRRLHKKRQKGITTLCKKCHKKISKNFFIVPCNQLHFKLSSLFFRELPFRIFHKRGPLNINFLIKIPKQIIAIIFH